MSYTHNNAGKLLITTSADAEYLIVRVGVRDSGTSITYWNFQLEEGNTATPYEPYIPSVKMLAEEVSAQNSNLSDYGLNNVARNIIQGRWIHGSYELKENTVCTDKLKCNGGEKINVKLKEIFKFIWVEYFDANDNYLSSSGDVVDVSKAQFTIPTNAKKYVVNFQKAYGYIVPITPQTVGHIGIYVDNSIDELKNDLMDLKMLGWSVPKECPIQNYIDSDGVFHQRVGRVDLGDQYYVYNGNDNLFYFAKITDAKPLGQCVYQKFNGVTGNSYQKDWDIALNETSHNVTYINAPGYTDPATLKHDLTGIYLYYELAEEKTINVDGNEVTERIKNDLGGLKFSASGTTLTITDGTNTWTLSN